MKKLYLNLIKGVIGTFIIYGGFIFFQVSFAQDLGKSKVVITDSTSRENIINPNNQEMRSLEWRVEIMEKYVNESQKNLDMWLKLLTFILSVLIGYSIFSGLRTRELAKEELSEIRRIKDEIKVVAKEAEDRLKVITAQILLIENTAVNAKDIESRMTEQLNEIGSRTDLVFNNIQNKIIDEAITKTKNDLQKSGIDTFKNLYYAKALKARSNKNWDESLRLWNNYIDLDDSNPNAFFQRGLVYGYLARTDAKLYVKALEDYNEAIRLDYDSPEGINNNIGNVYRNKKDYKNALLHYNKGIQIRSDRINELSGEEQTKEKKHLAQLYVNRGITYMLMKDYNTALSEFNKAIDVKENYAYAIKNRGKVYQELGKTEEAEADFTRAKELDDEITET